MRLMIDASLLAWTDAWSGVQVYSYHLLRAMAEIGANDSFLLRFDVDHASAALDALCNRPNVRRQTRPGGARFHGLLPLDLLASRSHAYYSLTGRLRTRLPRPAAMIVYDCGWLVHPEFYPAGEAEQQAAEMRRSAANAAVIFTISQAVKQEIVELLRCDPGCVVPAPPGGGLPAATTETADDAAAPDAIEPFALMVNPGRPTKNAKTAVAAFAAYRRDNPRSQLRLVLAGELRGEQEAVMAAIRGHGMDDHVTLCGFVDDERLNRLYAGARMLVYPSWYEGFGIPLIEAMERGVPVIASDIPVHREVAADAAVLVPPGDDAAMADAIARVETDGSLRSRLIAAGRARRECYSWERSAAVTLGTLAEL